MAIRVGIISANWGTFAHLPAWRAVPGVEVTAVCTSRQETAEAAARQHGIPKAFWCADQMAADPDIDLIDCGTRPVIREAMVLNCLKQGKHVYNGVPFAANVAGARAIHAAWQQSGVIGVTDAYLEWIPAHRLMKERLDNGDLGDLFGGTCTFNMSLFNTLRPGFPYNWFAQSGQGVSAVRNLGSHALHLLTFLFGEIVELVAEDRQLLREWRGPHGEVLQSGTNDFAAAMLRFASGLTLQLQVSWNAPLGAGWQLDLFGAKGRMVVEAPSFPTSRDTVLWFGRLGDAGGLEAAAIPDRLMNPGEVQITPDTPVPASHPMALAMHAMIRDIQAKGDGQGGGGSRPDFAQGWYVERVQEAIHLSALERRWVALAEVA